MDLIDDLIKKNEHKLKNVAQELYAEGENVTYAIGDGEYKTRYQGGKCETFTFDDEGNEIILKVDYE